MLHLLDDDLLAMVCTTPAIMCKLTAVSRHILQTLSDAVGRNKAHAVRYVTWREKRLAVHLCINAPHIIRLVWKSFGTTKEMRIGLPTAELMGQTINGTTNLTLDGMDITSLIYTRRGAIKASTRFQHAAVAHLAPGVITIRLRSEYGRRLPNGKTCIELHFQVPDGLYTKFLSLVPPSMREQHAAPTELLQ